MTQLQLLEQHLKKLELEAGIVHIPKARLEVKITPDGLLIPPGTTGERLSRFLDQNPEYKTMTFSPQNHDYDQNME